MYELQLVTSGIWEVTAYFRPYLLYITQQCTYQYCIYVIIILPFHRTGTDNIFTDIIHYQLFWVVLIQTINNIKLLIVQAVKGNEHYGIYVGLPILTFKGRLNTCGQWFNRVPIMSYANRTTRILQTIYRPLYWSDHSSQSQNWRRQSSESFQLSTRDR